MILWLCRIKKHKNREALDLLHLMMKIRLKPSFQSTPRTKLKENELNAKKQLHGIYITIWRNNNRDKIFLLRIKIIFITIQNILNSHSNTDIKIIKIEIHINLMELTTNIKDSIKLRWMILMHIMEMDITTIQHLYHMILIIHIVWCLRCILHIKWWVTQMENLNSRKQMDKVSKMCQTKSKAQTEIPI